MSYVEGRVVLDADAHVMETEDWLDAFTERALLGRVRATLGRSFSALRNTEIAKAKAAHADPDYRRRCATEVMLRKNYWATGSFLREDRALALDAIGVRRQLVFPTLCSVALEALEGQSDEELLYGFAAATNRAQVNFCAADKRLLPVGYVPLANRQRAIQATEQALELGCQALLIPWACPTTHATSHIDFDAVWARASEARVPVVFHVGVADKVLPAQHKVNGLPPEPDFHGGDENFRSVSYMAIPAGPMQALTLLILDGVLERFPALMFGVIELGAVWLPGYMRQLESAFDAFARHEKRLQTLSLRPSEYIRRQVRVTPYPTEPTGWIIENAGDEVCLFSTDYPHVEGGRNPLGRFDAAISHLSDYAKRRFFRENFESLMRTKVEA